MVKALNRWHNAPFVADDALAHTFTPESTLLKKVLLDLEKIAPARFTYKNGAARVGVK
jgi:hypothetical protein